jgi:hypothetical protein
MCVDLLLKLRCSASQYDALLRAAYAATAILDDSVLMADDTIARWLKTGVL